LPVRRSVSPTRKRAAAALVEERVLGLGLALAEAARVPVEQAALEEPGPVVHQVPGAAVTPVPDPAEALAPAKAGPRRFVPVRARIPPVDDILPS
jgi:hypothetical protein